MKQKTILIVFIFAITQVVGCSQLENNPSLQRLDNQADQLSHFEAELESIRQIAMIPGMSAAIVKDQQLIWAQGFGYVDLDKQIPASQDTPYFLASVTKPFAAILLMQLVEQGELNLADPISNYGIRVGNPDVIQVRHILSHTSNGEQPGEKFQYNGDRFAELDLVFKPASGKSFSENLNEQIIEPVGMENSAPSPISRGDGLAKSYAIWFENQSVYRQQTKPYRLDQDYQLEAGQCSEFFMPAAGLISTVTDLAKFDIALDQNQFLLPETKAKMFEPTVSTTGQVLPHGIGWFSQEYEGQRMIWHYGWQPGCSSTLYLKIPEEHITFLILANSDNLSRPYRLGSGEVLPIDSTVALAFYKAFVFESKYNLSVPQIDWEGNPQDITGQLRSVDNPKVLNILERELLSYWRLFQSVGNFDQADRLMEIHTQIFPQTHLDDYPALTEPVPAPDPFIRLPLMAHLTVAIFILLVTLTWVFGWPIAAVVKRLQKKKTGLTKATSGLERSARMLTVISGLLFMTILVVYIFYLSRFPADGNLEWSQSGGLVKILLGAALLSGVLSIGSFMVAILGLIKRAWPRLMSFHYALIGIAYALNIYLWSQLGFYDWLL